MNEGRGQRLSKIPSSGEGLFRGWLKCDHPDCGRLITYDPKIKMLKNSGEQRIYHYYRCSNSRKVHETVASISETALWGQLEPDVFRL